LFLKTPQNSENLLFRPHSLPQKQVFGILTPFTQGVDTN